MAAANLSELVTTTARRWILKLEDNVSNDNGFFQYLKSKGRIEKWTGGGRTIVETISYGTNSSAQWYADYDAFTPPITSEVADGAEYSWKQIGGFIAVSGKEERINRSDEQRISFTKARLKQLTAQLKNSVATGLYATGSGNGGKEFGGLQLLVADDPTAAGTVGGINQVTNTWWRNKYSAAAATTSATIVGRMNSMWLAIKRGADVPTLWVCDDDMFGYYEAALQALNRFTSQDEADAGFTGYKYKGKSVIYDDQCPNKHMYALNLDELTLRTIDDRMFDVGDARTIANADYKVTPVFTMGQLTTGRRAGHGVIIAS